MIEYIVPTNPDDRIFKRVDLLLREGKIIAFPTDTHWVMATASISKNGVESLYKLKGVDRKKHLSLICRDISQASQFAIITNSVFRLVKRAIPGPYAFIFAPTRDLPKVLKSYERDKEIGIRFPNSPLVDHLLKFLDFPLLSTSILPSMLEGEEFLNSENEYAEIYSYQIEDYYGQHLSMILDPGEFEVMGDSTVIDFSQGDAPIVVRQGHGDIYLSLHDSPFGEHLKGLKLMA